MDENNTPPSQTPQCVNLHLYKPAKIFKVHFRAEWLHPYTSGDTRGSATMYNTKHAKYYLLRLDKYTDKGLSIDNSYNVYTNDHDLPPNPEMDCREYKSTSKHLNLNYLIEIYLNFVFSHNRQFPRSAINKYFFRLRTLLQGKFQAIRDRINKPLGRNKQTKTYLWFLINHMLST